MRKLKVQKDIESHCILMRASKNCIMSVSLDVIFTMAWFYLTGDWFKILNVALSLPSSCLIWPEVGWPCLVIITRVLGLSAVELLA